MWFPSDPRTFSRARLALAGVLVVGSLLAFIAFAYELALAKVPQHRAALERLVRSQTGLEIRFSELTVRWGWYGPEALFRQVELQDPALPEVRIRAPELIVGLDAWRTLRTGQPEAGRIEFVAADIDLAGPSPIARASATRPVSSPVNRMEVLERWRGRVELEGGSLRIPDPGGASPLTFQIRRATFRRSDDEWDVYGLVVLPDRLGRTARVVMRLEGDLRKPDTLSGSLRIEGRRLVFGGWRDYLGGYTQVDAYVPRGGTGDVSGEVTFSGGGIVKADGSLRATDLKFGSLVVGPEPRRELSLARLRGDWRLARLDSGWRVRVDSLGLSEKEAAGTLTLDAGTAGEWVRGQLEGAQSRPVVDIARWLMPSLDLAGVELEGLTHRASFDWNRQRSDGDKLRLFARLDEVTLVPASRDFTLSGLGAVVSGNERQVNATLRSRNARLELAQSRQYPLADIRVAASLHIENLPTGWQLGSDEFVLEHGNARLNLRGVVRGGPDSGPQIQARGTLTGADIPLLERVLGDSTAQAFGAAASRLTAGSIANAEFELHGPVGELPFGGRGAGFTGSLTLEDGVVSGGDLWPDAKGIRAHIDWHGAAIQAAITSGRAGSFQLADIRADWDAAGSGATRLSGQIRGPLEDALDWLRTHPQLESFAPEVQHLEARGVATFNVRVLIPGREREVQARFVTSLERAQVQTFAGLPPVDAVSGSFTYERGHLQRSTLTGSWLGGPVTIRLGERREHGLQALVLQAQGSLDARELAARQPAMLAGGRPRLQGCADWSAELAFVRDRLPSALWRMKADSSLTGVASTLPEPFAKRAGASLALHLEVSGTDQKAQMRINLGERARSILALQKRDDGAWILDKGALRLGTAPVALPMQKAMLVQGHVARLDLPAWLVGWQHLPWDLMPDVRAQIAAGEMSMTGHTYEQVSVRMERTAAGTQMQLDGPNIFGVGLWPSAGATAQGLRSENAPRAAEVHFARLEVGAAARPDDEWTLGAALAPQAHVVVDELVSNGRSLGQLTGSVSIGSDSVIADDLRLRSPTHDLRGSLHCRSASETCRLTFAVDSTDAATTLMDFGFAPDLNAERASLAGDVQWRPGTQAESLASLAGQLSMTLTSGSLHSPAPVSAAAAPSLTAGPSLTAAPAQTVAPFPLFGIPALLSGLQRARGLDVNVPGRPDRASAGQMEALDAHPLRFERLEGDFELAKGQATTTDLHFDGDAEILMRGRTGLVAQDYDEQAWVLRGEERLPAAIRRLGASPRVAAAWLSLRQLYTGSGDRNAGARSLRLQGTWDDPMVRSAE